MSRVIIRQLSLLLITLFLISLLSFSMSYWFPGDPVTNASGIPIDHPRYEEVFEKRGFDSNIAHQYISYLRSLFEGDWGQSMQDNSEIWDELSLRLPATLELTVIALAIALCIGPPLGIIAAKYYRKPIDQVIAFISLAGYSVPVFWLAQVTILIFAVVLDVVPIAGQINPLFDVPAVSGSILIDIALSDIDHKWIAFQNAFLHIVLPAIVLATAPCVLLVRFTRASAIHVLQQKFVKGAYARGLSTAEVMFKHAIPNTMQPVTRQLSTAFSVLVTNVLITEVIFSWPGLGNWLVRSIYERDFPVIQHGLLVLASIILTVNVFANILQAWRYPQVRQEFYAR
ncbi:MULTISPECIES: ABC transporter permease [Gammaproteobacteria]|uniref:ABC transporter permease n=1 Tax=Gammaproteobacteria TaxID=1236 RepID=UPI000DCF9C9E|nr:MULTISPECIES: ABC transporter permease [Gammaproteobacteria]RTE87135.1 ABC transporter permease [Aliidiomarina sp. B3213]TCZ93077.1 ABC transporter permease [Lysobacter sp. N42]